MKNQAIYTEKSNCKDCYRCIRECPVKAIKVRDNSASIIHEQCIYCGHCTMICPVGAKKIRSETAEVKAMLKQDRVILALAPSYKALFAAYTPAQLETLLKKCGFYALSETAIGADIINQATTEWLNQEIRGVVYSSSCPVTVELITKYYPHLANRISPFVSPFIAQCRLLRKIYGSSVKLVFASPCPAKKMENDRYQLFDAVLTFAELQEMIGNLQFAQDSQPDFVFAEPYFVPYRAGSGVFYPVEGGMLRGLELLKHSADTENKSTDNSFNLLAVSSIPALQKIFKMAQPDKYNLFVEVMACTGGCVNGPGYGSEDSELTKKVVINLQMSSAENQPQISAPATVPALSSEELAIIMPQNQTAVSQLAAEQGVSNSDLLESLKSIGKNSPQDELNCKGCGYESCRELAKALLSGKAERNMCVYYMRNVAADKASVLLQKMPYGVVIVNDKMEIVECNRIFATLFGEDIVNLFNAKPGLVNADLCKIAAFHPLFNKALTTGQENNSRDIHVGGRYLNLSIFTIQPHKLVCGIIRDLNLPDVQKDEVLVKARKVIRENLATVQKVAYLLGENSSSTEILLNSIIKLYADIESNHTDF